MIAAGIRCQNKTDCQSSDSNRCENSACIFHTHNLFIDANIAENTKHHSWEEVQNLRKWTVKSITLNIKSHDIMKIFWKIRRHDIKWKIYASLTDYDRPDGQTSENWFEWCWRQINITFKNANFTSQITFLIFTDETIRFRIFWTENCLFLWRIINLN